MEKLRKYLNGLDRSAQIAFAERCGTTVGYLRKCLSTGQALAEGVCIKVEKESGREVWCEDLRPDVDWTYLRAGQPPKVEEVEQLVVQGSAAEHAEPAGAGA